MLLSQVIIYNLVLPKIPQYEQNLFSQLEDPKTGLLRNFSSNQTCYIFQTLIGLVFTYKTWCDIYKWFLLGFLCDTIR